jgi:hypothetical protein
MQSATDLVKLRDAIHARTRALRYIVSRVSTSFSPDDRRSLAYVTIELDNLIVCGLRQYAKSSLLRSRTAAGVRITASINPSSTEEAAAYILRTLNPKKYANISNPPSIKERDEITIRDPKEIEKVLIAYSASNLSNFVVALSLNAKVFSEAKICRHFFAHRAKNTYEAVQLFSLNLGIAGIDMPEKLLIRGRPSNGVRFLDGWLSDVENFFDLAT